jgi:uncharacterized protein DUF11
MSFATVATALCAGALSALGLLFAPSAGAEQLTDVKPTITVPATVAPGSTFTITISVENLGPAAAHRVATDFYFGQYVRLHKNVQKGQLRLVGTSEGALQVGTFVHWRDETIMPFTAATHTVTLELSPRARLHSIMGTAIVECYEPEETDDDNNTESFAVTVGG